MQALTPLFNIAGASLFGILLSKYETVTCLKLAVALMMWALPVVLSSGVLDRAKCPQTCCKTSSRESLPHADNLVDISMAAIKHRWSNDSISDTAYLVKEEDSRRQQLSIECF
ncbi:solute carrier family 40 member 3, chloroplastic [Tanacetum coccineum]